jgi:hypothetical protein
MCFSATASLAAGAAITMVGIASVNVTHHRTQLLFAAIPLIFGVQQLIEGLLWLQLRSNPSGILSHFGTHAFLFLAQVVWPFWVPLSILLLEKKENRTSVQRWLVAGGAALSIYFAYCQLNFSVASAIDGHHIIYFRDYPFAFDIISIAAYATVTILPAFLSRIKYMRLLGVSIAVSFLISSIFYQHYVLSVWCFFAAIISISIYIIMRGIANAETRQKFRAVL